MTASVGSEPYEPHNLLDRLSQLETLQQHYEHLERRIAPLDDLSVCQRAERFGQTLMLIVRRSAHG